MPMAAPKSEVHLFLFKPFEPENVSSSVSTQNTEWNQTSSWRISGLPSKTFSLTKLHAYWKETRQKLVGVDRTCTAAIMSVINQLMTGCCNTCPTHSASTSIVFITHQFFDDIETWSLYDGTVFDRLCQLLLRIESIYFPATRPKRWRNLFPFRPDLFQGYFNGISIGAFLLRLKPGKGDKFEECRLTDDGESWICFCNTDKKKHAQCQNGL